ncbi:pyruvate kinase [Actinomarinicola tropica]|uniref:Pyruvate kinase n=1 Tax=Actinomarinicola tropica TaxID=2789776 RepID=A0A5Q2REU6_9ACTN|nr:pyruvate kinase [Actinomarinicola tropica]QGG95339.1 pyruvate kinase [Actinomarinicola tropica]
MSRRTKIIATIGPASDDPATLRAMIEGGMDVARIGLAHGTVEEQMDRFQRVRRAATDVGRNVGILVDLPGPKVRAGSFGEDDGVTLMEGTEIRLTPGSAPSTPELVHVDYDHLLADIHPGDRLMFGDGAVIVEIHESTGNHLIGRVAHGGWVQGRPGVHIPSDRLRVASPTDRDLELLDTFIDAGTDMVALSFVRSAHDIRRAGVEPHPRGPLIVAKIETRAAVDNLEGIVEASGAIMVARGDLGEEFAIDELPHLQKDIIAKCIAMGRPVITATQMLESMIHAPSPTRAEATDVANAVFDGTSAVMLSAETAIGHDPALVIATMSRIAGRADERFDYDGWAEQLQHRHIVEVAGHDTKVTDTVTMAAWRAAMDMDANAIICITRSGFTARAIARFRPEAKILAYSPDDRTVHQLSMSWGATAMLSGAHGRFGEMVDWAVSDATSKGHVRSGDVVVVVAGSREGAEAADTMRVVRVP